MFVGDYQSAVESKTFVVGINYPSFGCGRVSKHISFADKVNAQAIGQIKEYGIRAIQLVNNAEEVTGMSVTPYRIPFLVQVSGSVLTTSRSGVEGVTVSFCHIDPLTAEEDTDQNYCPFKQFTTDKRGLFSGEFRISNPFFNNSVEYFDVTANKTEILSDGFILEHVFSPVSQKVSFQHLTQTTITITDNSSITIFGKIIFDPANTNNIVCPFSGVDVNMVDGSGKLTTSTSAADGGFNFTVSLKETAVVYIPSFQGHEWDSFITTAVPESALQTPSVEPTLRPSAIPTHKPSRTPSYIPSVRPTFSPSTVVPTRLPSVIPTILPTLSPSLYPTLPPTAEPSVEPTTYPSTLPLSTPTANPSAIPSTSTPTYSPSLYPTLSPTDDATAVVSNSRSRRLSKTKTEEFVACLFGDCTHNNCIAGTICVYQNPYYSQCLLNRNTDQQVNCIANYNSCAKQSTVAVVHFLVLVLHSNVTPLRFPHVMQTFFLHRNQLANQNVVLQGSH